MGSWRSCSWWLQVGRRRHWPALNAEGRATWRSTRRQHPQPDPGEPPTNGQHVYRYDRRTGAVQRVSVNPTGQPANNGSWFPDIGADGQTVAFSSAATHLVAGDTVARRLRQPVRVAAVGHGRDHVTPRQPVACSGPGLQRRPPRRASPNWSRSWWVLSGELERPGRSDGRRPGGGEPASAHVEHRLGEGEYEGLIACSCRTTILQVA